MVFDMLAADYDRDFTSTRTGRWLRGRVHARLNTLYQPGQRILELGCGTGEDARHLAAQGIHVTATDASQEMLKIAAAKNAATPLATFAHLDLSDLPEDGFTGPYDGAFASFGVLNCLADWQPLAVWLAKRVRPGSKLAFGVMSPYCLWEIAWHAAHLDLKTATRRLRPAAPFKVSEDVTLAIHYPPPRRMVRDFKPQFRQIHREGLALFLPTSEAFGVVEKRPRLFRALSGIDYFALRFGWLAALADHYWVEFERLDS